MNIEKIAINGNYVWVDKDVEIKEGDMCVDIAHNVIVKPTDLEWANSNSDNLKVIVAASPELNLEDVPSYVEYLATKKLYEKYPYHPPQDDGYLKDMFKEGYESAEKEKSDELLTKYQEGMKKGLELSKELFTEEDVIKAIVMSATSPTDNLMDRCDEIINHLKKSKV